MKEEYKENRSGGYFIAVCAAHIAIRALTNVSELENRVQDTDR